MGMYDEIVFEYPTPDSEVQNEVFQTYDTGRKMHRYYLDKDGVLYYEAWQIDSKGFLMYGVSTYKRTRSHFTGKIECYTKFQPHWKNNRVGYEYEFYLENGQLISVIDRTFYLGSK